MEAIEERMGEEAGRTGRFSAEHKSGAEDFLSAMDKAVKCFGQKRLL